MNPEKKLWTRVLSGICCLVCGVLLHLALSALLDSMYAAGIIKRLTADQLALQAKMINDILRIGLVIVAVPGIPTALFVAGLLVLDWAYPDEKRKNDHIAGDHTGQDIDE